MRCAGRMADACALGDGRVQSRRENGERRRCGRAPSGASSCRWRRISSGKYRFRLLHTPHVPHCWEATHLFEETQGTPLCSDLLHQNGDVEPSTSSDVVGRFKQALMNYQQGPLANYMPYTPYTESTLHRLAALKPRTLAAMHGSTFVGDGAKAYRCRAGPERSPGSTLARWQRTSAEAYGRI